MRRCRQVGQLRTWRRKTVLFFPISYFFRRLDIFVTDFSGFIIDDFHPIFFKCVWACFLFGFLLLVVIFLHTRSIDTIAKLLLLDDEFCQFFSDFDLKINKRQYI